MKSYFMGIDIGTSSVRAVLFDRDGIQAAAEGIECSLSATFDGAAELDPEFVVNAVFAVVNGCMNKAGVSGNDVEAVGLSCHMHSLMALDGKGNPLTRLMTWADTRAKKEALHIEESYDATELYRRTGCRVQHPLYPLSKMLWLRNNEPDLFRKASKFVTIKEYLIFRLFGEFAVDYTLASCQGYYNIHEQKWDESIVSGILGIDAGRLGTPVECTHLFRGMKPEYAGRLGLDRDIPFVIGSGDGIMANLGCGVTDDTSLSSTIGTSGAIRTTVDKPLLDPKQRTWCYSFTKDAWVSGGAINNGGLVLKWLRETFRRQFEFDAAAFGENVYKLFDRFAGQVNPGSDGLIFLPYLTGERSPDWNAEVRGLMVGMDYSHGRMHMVRAAMEGVIYRLYSVYEAISAINTNAAQIRATGGYIKSDVWMQIQADIFNKEILVCPVNEASALGAAYTAMVASGAAGSLRDILPAMKPRKVVEPIRENHEKYIEAYGKAMMVYGSIYGNIYTPRENK